MLSKEEIQKKYGVKDKDDWMKLQDGHNKVRIVSDFVDYGVHSVEEGGKYHSVVCIGKENGCVYCKRGDKPKVQFLGWVIDRSDGEIKLLRIGWTIFNKLDALRKSDEYKFSSTPSYDIDIVRTGKGLDTDYDVIPSRKDIPLTEEEEAKVLNKIKDPNEIIEKMKEKVLPVVQEEQGEEEISAMDIDEIF